MRIGIIGAGSAGYVAAIRAADLGAEVSIFEKEKIGGTCLNVGCIPTKALIAGLHALKVAKNSSVLGVDGMSATLDYDILHDHKNKVVETNVKGIQYLLNKRKVKTFDGNATIPEPGIIDSQGDRFEFDKIIIATGSIPAKIPGIEYDGKFVMNSDHALSLREIPSTMLIVGGGVIGLEFAGIFSALGTKVTIVEMMDRLLPQDDDLCSKAAMKFATKSGIDVLLGAKITKLFRDGGEVETRITKRDGEEIVTRFHKALVAVGRAPNLDTTSLTRLGINYDRGGIKVDSFMQTSTPNVYAIGDCTGGYMLAHVAYAQAKVAAAHAVAGKSHPMRYDNIPRVTFVDPEIAACGYTSGQLEERDIHVSWHKFSYMASGRAKAQGIKDGSFHIAVDDDRRIRSAVITGEGAGEMISFFSQAIAMETTIERLEQVIIPHPTLSEMAAEVIECAGGMPVHM
ncbi:MAG TPA: dihydrolipoyl dehydrogenase [Caldisericia bacterium]|nr:dihydrolipoyl dehydrogenase [Caldisericia bacterium]HPF48665.1 dihydrolipoyl dehydrogenase [Caldisericia bacterium]HPI83675.1 dihydrolipoyl dehydrogenase [Caldisericia bacterium]HPQ93120.1 dihydrolipoyl dehydrogenase [Caldisericia bacterium]HRV75047.1 dihydrolipoyl dehydrogenase [Caldisericia bacterium]